MNLLLLAIIAAAIPAGTSLLLAALGEILTERSGVLNLGIEGIMLTSAVCSFAVAYHSDNLLLGVLTGALVGSVLSFVHAFLTVSLHTDQIVTGLAITIFGTGLSAFLGQRLGPEGGSLVGLTGPSFEKISWPGLTANPDIAAILQQDIMTYTTLLLVPVISIFLTRIQEGLNLRAVGENPRAADALGVNVTKLRYRYTIIGGSLAGLAGAHLSLAYTPGWTEGLTGGRGWIAIALVVFATWNPSRALVGAILFGSINALQFRLQAMGTTISPAFLGMLPYASTIFVLIIITRWESARKRSSAPAALGVPYSRE